MRGRGETICRVPACSPPIRLSDERPRKFSNGRFCGTICAEKAIGYAVGWLKLGLVAGEYNRHKE